MKKKNCNCKEDKTASSVPKFVFKRGERVGVRYEGKNYYGYVGEAYLKESPKLKRYIFFGPPKIEKIYDIKFDNGEIIKVPEQRIFSIDKY